MSETQARPSPARGPCLRVARTLTRGVVPELVGLSVVGLVVFAALVPTWLLVRRADAMRREVARQLGQELADTLALAVGASWSAADTPDREAITSLFSRVAGLKRVHAVRWSDARGAVIADVRAAAGKQRIERVEARAAVRTPDGQPAGELTIELTVPPAGGLRGAAWWASATCAVLALLTFAGLYALIRRRVRPITAIASNLESLASGIEQELAALTLSDSLGQTARAWNTLLEQLCELRRQAEKGGRPAADDSQDALARFESRKLVNTLDRLPVGVLRFGSDRRISYANQAAARLLGAVDGPLVGRDLEEVVGDEVAAPLIGAQKRAHKSVSFERTTGEGDAAMTLRFTVFPGSPESGGGETLVTIEDVTYIQEAERARDNFLYHVTHELRTPLTNIQAYAETLTKPAFDDEQTRRECYNVIIGETRRLSNLVESILSISQLEVGSARLQIGEVDLVRLLRKIVQDNLGAADEKQIDLTLKLPPKVPKLRGDKERLSVLLSNLIGNAIKYTPPGGEVRVWLEVEEKLVRIHVQDTGIGIDPKDQPYIFEKFYRAHSEQVQQITGTGLGLAIAREVARLHGGDIRLESEPGRGSTFTVELPRPDDETATAT